MLRLRHRFALTLLCASPLVAFAGCGDDEEVGSNPGTGGSGGTAGCGPMPGPMDCEGCSGFTSPVCENGSWTCPPLNCPDAGPDAATCGAGHVPTIDGCLSCVQASTKLGQLIEAARAKNASCSTEMDCVMTGSATACNGSCGVAVSKAGEAAFQAALTKIDTGYCAGFVPVCGYSTPKCAMPTLVCNAGQCEAKY